jgi:hypothetical protein
MHNSLFGGISDEFVTGSEDMDLGSQLTLTTAFINHQNQQIQVLTDAIKQIVQITTYIKDPFYKPVSKKSI